MTIVLPQTKFPDKMVQEIIRAALRDQANLARLRAAQFVNECRAFEERFHMNTEDFVNKFEAGELGDDEIWFDWFAAARGREVWSVKANVLLEVAA